MPFKAIFVCCIYTTWLLQIGFILKAQPNNQTDSLIAYAKSLNKYSGTTTLDSVRGKLQSSLLLDLRQNERLYTLRLLSRLEMFRSNYDSAEFYNEKYGRLLDKMPKVTKGRLAYLMRKGAIHKHKGNFAEALIQFHHALDICHSVLDSGLTIQNIGWTYTIIGDHESALKNYETAYRCYFESNEMNRCAVSAAAIGDTWYALGEIDSAMWWYNQSLSLERWPGTTLSVQTSLAKLYWEQDLKQKAIKALQEVAGDTHKLATKKELLAQYWAVVSIILNTPYADSLSRYFPDIDTQSARKLSLRNADQCGNRTVQINTRVYMANHLTALSDQAIAKNLLLDAMKLKTSSYDMAKLKAYNMEAALAKSRAAEEISKQLLINEKQRTMLVVSSSGILALFCILGLLVYLRYKQKVHNEQLAKRNDEIIRKNKILVDQRKTILDQKEQLKKYQEKWILGVQSIVLNNLSEVNSTMIAQAYHTSQRTLYRKIKKYTGVSPDKFIQEIKLDKAAEIFYKHPEKNISEVAYQCGFNDPAHFSRVFKTKFGSSPTQYARDLQGLKIASE